MRINHNNHNDHSHNSNNSHIYQQVLDKIHKTLESIESDHNLTPDERHSKLIEINELESKAKDIQSKAGNEHEATQAYEEILDRCSTLSSTSHNLGKATEYHHCLSDLQNAIAYINNHNGPNQYQKHIAVSCLKSMISRVHVIAQSGCDDYDKVAQYKHLEHLCPAFEGQLPQFLPKSPPPAGKKVTLTPSISTMPEDIRTLYDSIYQKAEVMLNQAKANNQGQGNRNILITETLNNMIHFMNETVSTPNDLQTMEGNLGLISENIAYMNRAYYYFPHSFQEKSMSAPLSHTSCLEQIEAFKSEINSRKNLSINKKQAAINYLDTKINELDKVKISNKTELDKQNEYAQILNEIDSVYSDLNSKS